jgi:polar amino acid transport system permease protein
MDFDIHYLLHQWPALLKGVWVTLNVSIVAIILSLLIGLLGATVRYFKLRWASPLIAGYVEFIRNTPLLGQMFFIYYGLPGLGVPMSLYGSSVLTLTLWAGAYQIENFRGGLNAVPLGLREAATAMSLNRWQFMWLIARPVALRSSLPALLNTAVSLLKNSAFLQAIGLAELTYVAVNKIASDFRTLEMLAAMCVIYLALVGVLSLAAAWLEARLHKPYRT